MEEDIQKGEVVLYQPNETVRLEVRLENETVWLTQQQMVIVFDSSRTNIVEHIKHIYAEGELSEESTCRKFRQVQMEGTRKVTRTIPYYNLDMIISVGYRVNTKRGILFRQWANAIIKEYLFHGYAINSKIQKEINERLVCLQEHTDCRINQLEYRIDNQQKQIEHQQEFIDLYIKTNTLPQEQLFQNGCVFDAWTYVSSLITSAKQEIILVDNYAHESVLALFAKRADGVTATIHTRYTMKFTTDLSKFNKQYPDKAVKYIQLSQKNHDRFLIIDNDVYLLGASLKDLGETWGAIIKMNETKKADILNNLSS